MRNKLIVKTISTFIILIGTGCLLLILNGFRGNLKYSTITSALFTSVSAVSVTGLSVIDLSKNLNFTGQLIVLLLIQFGGLGILTFSNWIFLTIRKKIDVQGIVIIREIIGDSENINPVNILIKTVLMTFFIEIIGAIALFIGFIRDFPLKKAIWYSVFHSISAFCNAGFSLFSTSFNQYTGNFLINITLIILIICGGLGFVVLIDLYYLLKNFILKKPWKLAINSKIVIYTSSLLILSGFIFFLTMEPQKNHNITFFQKVLSSLFLSVTSRTAGFNTILIKDLTNMSLIFLMFLMIVGASPGSTGGGIKTTSLAIIFGIIRGYLKNRKKIELLDRSIPSKYAAKSIGVLIMYLSILFFSVITIETFEAGFRSYSSANNNFISYLFETISAMSTVGLSTGITSTLSSKSLYILMINMFAGKIGPLVLITSLIGEKPPLNYQYPEADILVG